jgi:hypothetical protein
MHGHTSMTLWKRSEGPSVIAYGGVPAFWLGAGMNSAGLACCWAWGSGVDKEGPRIGIPSYVLLAQMLYQETLKAAVEEARRAKQAGWFTFVLGDGKGNLVNIEGTPKQLVVEPVRGHLARANYGSRGLRTADGEPVKMDPQGRRMSQLLEGSKGKLDQPALQSFFGDHKSTICRHEAGNNGFTLDSMLFNCTKREVHIKRGPGCVGHWETFRFEDK